MGLTIIPDPSAGDPIRMPPPPTVVASYSSDGVHWHVGQKLDPVAAGSTVLNTFRSVLEGPTGLLAVGWSQACGSEYVDSLWTSADGIVWRPVDVSKVFGRTRPEINRISGGSAGFVAVAYGGAGAWTSRDGRTWKRVGLTAATFQNSHVDDGTAMAGGFVLAGVTGTRDCSTSVQADGSPTPTPKPVFRTPSVWWSADGTSWSRRPLPGAVADSETHWMWTAHLSDRAVLVVDGSSGSSAWGSNDGRNWRSVKLPEDLDQQDIVSDGRHNVFLAPGSGEDEGTGDPTRLSTFDDNFASFAMTASGAIPEVRRITHGMYGLLAIGPTGVVVTNGGGKMWLGVPSAQ